jgi:hypothetical protein
MQRYSLRVDVRFDEAPTAEQRRRIGTQLQKLHGRGAVPPGIEWSDDGRSAQVIIGALFMHGTPVQVVPVREEVDSTLRAALTEPADADVRYEISVEPTLIDLGVWPSD